MWIVAGLSAVAVVSAEIFPTVILYWLSKTLGSFWPAFWGNSLFPPCLIDASTTLPVSSVYLIGISKSSFAYTYTSFLPSIE